jgi:hypothetical protein
MSMVGTEYGETTTASILTDKGKSRKGNPVRLKGRPLLRVAAMLKPVEHKNHGRGMDRGTMRREIYRHNNPDRSHKSSASVWFAHLESETQYGNRIRDSLLATAGARASAATATAALASLVAVPAKHRSIATRLKRHCCRLAATRTNHRCSLCWSRTVAGAPLVLLFCLTAILATLRGRITTFLKERLIRSGEGKVLPAIAARK